MSSKENICKEENAQETNEEPFESGKKKAAAKDLKLVRFLTVLAYLISVSTPAMLLSSYYLFLWQSPTFNQTKTAK